MDVNAATQIKLREFVLSTFFPDSSPSELKNDTALISSGLVNSLKRIRLVAFIENEFSIQVDPTEMNCKFLDTIDMMAQLIAKKQATATAE